jgi:hypothetical protein
MDCCKIYIAEPDNAVAIALLFKAITDGLVDIR